jgi:uncharacterized Fe-S cluster-containing radical SAM superfamily protein
MTQYRHFITSLRIHITDRCNLRCKYCSHYCDFEYGGDLCYAQGEEWLRASAERLAPEMFRIMGGEPLLSKDAEKDVRLVAECFSKSFRTFLTNGLLLRKREDIFSVLMETDTELFISLHPLASKKQEAIINDALILAFQYQEKGLRLRIRDVEDRWRRYYLGEGVAIEPFSGGDPEKSYASCHAKNCTILHRGKLWKCPNLAFLPMIVDKLETKRIWEPYLRYEPLGLDASDEAIAAFIKEKETPF